MGRPIAEDDEKSCPLCGQIIAKWMIGIRWFWCDSCCAEFTILDESNDKEEEE